VLVLDIHAGAKLLEIEPAPVDPNRVADATGLLNARSTGFAHFSASLAVVARSAPVCQLFLIATVQMVLPPPAAVNGEEISGDGAP